jgi:hypothetical protein
MAVSAAARKLMAARKVPSASAVLEKAGMSFMLPTPPLRAPRANKFTGCLPGPKFIYYFDYTWQL